MSKTRIGLVRSVAMATASTMIVAGMMSMARAEDVKTYEITLKGETFTPAELKVPAGKPFIIKVRNDNPAPAEFEAKDLKIEKVVAGGSEIIANVKALKPGSYLFVDEYHEDVAKGTLIAE